MISDEAVEAAAKAFIEHGTLLPALEAAAPHMLREAKADAWDEAWATGCRWNKALGGLEEPNPYRSQS